MKLHKPPSAQARPQEFKNHGLTRTDEYAWLKDAKDPQTLRYLKDENVYADTLMHPFKKIQNTLFKEIKARVTEDDVSVPIKDGPYLYYVRMKKGKQYAIHCRKPVSGGKEEIILDENALAADSSFFSLGDSDINADHTLLAYACDTTGNEKFSLSIKDLKTGRLMEDRIESVSAIVWSEDGKYIFYSKEEHPFPPRKIYRHALGDNPAKDVLIFEEKDPQWYVHIGKSRSEKYLFITVGNFDSTEIWYLKADEPTAQPQLFAERKKKVKYSVDHWGDDFLIVTNENAVNFKILHTSVSRPHKQNWKPWMPYDPVLSIVDMAAYRDFLAIELRKGGSAWIYVCKAGSKKLEKIPLPESEHLVSMVNSLEYASPVVRFVYSSFLTPKSTYEYEVKTKRLNLRKKQKAPGWNSKKFVSERIWVKNGDVKVPISLCYRKGMKLDGKAPLLLESYGSYGITYDPYYSIGRVSLLKRGWVIGIAHPRGGGELGWSWHEEAKLLTKHHTYEDVIACVDELVRKKYCDRSKTAITGGSAGGMSMGAILNIRPDLCGGAVVYVPNSDTVTSMLDESLGGTIMHYDELGDPRKKEFYDYFMRWSPYENISRVNYPPVLVRASLHDIRTPYWEAAKWVARLRARKTGTNPLLFKVEMHAGHAGKSGRYEWIKERAYDYAFLLTFIAMKK